MTEMSGSSTLTLLQEYDRGLFPFLSDVLSRNSGVLRPREVILVLGALGSGCTTFLKVIANERGARPPKVSGSPISGVFWVSAGG